MKIKLLNTKTVLSTVIFIIALSVLSACGSDAGEPLLIAEDNEAQISLADITWEDFDDGVYETILHFSFSNGNIVDKEIPYPSIVKNIEYRDITGDGEDEVIIYREFMNNIHDDYIVIDFFEIEKDTVTDISPSADISELSEWDTEVVSGHTEGYIIVLKMESYGKTAGILYTDKKMTVGYDKEHWRVIEQQEIADWKLAYLNYLVTDTDAVWADNCLFWLAYVDEVPELFFGADDEQFIVSLLSCENGKIEKLRDFGGQGTALWYQEKEGNLLCVGDMMENPALAVYHFQDGELTEGTYAYADISPDMDENPANWYWEEEKVSKEEYEKRSKAVTGQMTHRIQYENGMNFNELWSILGES